MVAAMNERSAALCEQLKAKGITPTLAVVRVGEREDDLSLRAGRDDPLRQGGRRRPAVRAARRCHRSSCSRVLDEVNTDNGIHGCLLFRPLPKQFDDRTVRAALRPEKRTLTASRTVSLAGVFTNTDLGYAPCTAQACMEILKYYNVPLSGKRAVVVGRSLVVGKRRHDADRENATVTLCNSRTRNLPEAAGRRNIVVVAMGKMGAVGADCLREGQTVVTWASM